jgi:peroxin-6
MQCINPELIKEVTTQTSGFMPRDIDALFADVAANFVHEAFINSERSTDNADIGLERADSLRKEDFLKALDRSKKRNASALGAPKVKHLFLNPIVLFFFLSHHSHDLLLCNLFLATIAVQVPNVKWEDVGGLEDVKKSILDTVQVISNFKICNVINN